MQFWTGEVWLIRVVVRRFVLSNHADAYPPHRCRGREASATTPALRTSEADVLLDISSILFFGGCSVLFETMAMIDESLAATDQ